MCWLLVGMQITAVTVESSMEIPQKIKNGSAFWLSNSSSRNVAEGTPNGNSQEHKNLYGHGNVIYKYKLWKQPVWPSADEWITQLWGIYTSEYYLAVQKKNVLFATVWIDMENVMLSEISQSEKDKYCMISLTWNLMNKLTRKTKTDS